MVVHCDASLITATGASIPYEMGEFSINFGDLTGTETITDPWTGNTVNLNNQVQPEAAYLYRTAGTYTITMTVRFCTSGNCTTTPAYTTASFTQNITVTTFNPSGGTFFYSAAGSGTTCSSGSPCALSQFASKIASNTQHNFNKGDNFAGTTGIDMGFNGSVSAVRLGAFGSGAKPKININSGGATPILISASHAGEVKSDIVVSGLEFDTSGAATSTNSYFSLTQSTATLKQIYFDNCDFINSVDVTGFVNVQTGTNNTPGVDTNQEKGYWMGSATSPLTAVNVKDAFLVQTYHHHFIYGFTINGTGGATFQALNHHVYHHIQLHGIDSYNTMGNSDSTGTNPTRNYNFKYSFDPGSDGPAGFGFGQFVTVTHNSMSGTARPTNLGNATNDPAVSRWKNVVYAKNIKQGFTGEDDPFTGETATWRDEDICNNGTNTSNSVLQLTPNIGTTSFLKARVYRERIYTTVAQPVFDFGPSAVTWTVPEVFADSQVQSTNSAAIMMNTAFSQQVSAGSTWDRNTWYCPNTSGQNCFDNNGTLTSFATWQASGFDTNGNQNNPNFPNGATCSLGPRQ